MEKSVTKSKSVLHEEIKSVINYSVNFGKIPPTLKNIPQWVLWNNEPLESKPRGNKVPKYNRTGVLRNASATEPSTWDVFDNACGDMNEFQTTGIGFVLTKPSGVFCIDIDECVHDLCIDDAAQNVMDIFSDKTYVELSFHNDGLHIFGLGNLPEDQRGGKRGGLLEVYDSGRFIAITGHKLSSANSDLTDCQHELDIVLSKYPKLKPVPKKELRTPATFAGERIQDKYGLSCVDIGYPSNASVVNGKIVGSHPSHGSSTGSNFHIDPYRNLWHCFRCESGGERPRTLCGY